VWSWSPSLTGLNSTGIRSSPAGGITIRGATSLNWVRGSLSNDEPFKGGDCVPKVIGYTSCIAEVARKSAVGTLSPKH
jgi:hypothetical protein